MTGHLNNCVENFMLNTNLELHEISELYAIFLDELTDNISDLAEALHGNNYSLMQQIAHNIKGIAGTYMAESIYSLAKDMDLKLKSNSTEQIEDKVTKLYKEASYIRNEIIIFFSDNNIHLEVEK